jgi:hypothetical protein
MSNQSFFKNKLAVGVMTLGLATTASLLASNSAEAVNLKFNVSGTYAAGGTVTGSFFYDGTNYSNWNLTSTSTTLAPAAAPLANPFTYTTTNAELNTGTLSTDTKFYISSPDSSAFPYRDLVFVFSNSLNTLVNVGDSTTLVANNRNPLLASYEQYGSTGQTLTAAISGGTVTVAAVPEPLTILGTLVAGGIGVGMKRKKQQLQKETV